MDSNSNFPEDFDEKINTIKPIKVEIPKIFHSTQTDLPFENCLCCNSNLIYSHIPYLINKKVIKNEVVFEYAICLNCHQKLAEEMSENSINGIGDFFHKRVDMNKRLNRLLAKKNNYQNTKVQNWFNGCVVCAMPRKIISRYSLVSYCKGINLICAHYPMMLCEICEEQLQEKISKKTRETFDDFIGTYFDCPPNLERPIPDKPSILV